MTIVDSICLRQIGQKGHWNLKNGGLYMSASLAFRGSAGARLGPLEFEERHRLNPEKNDRNKISYILYILVVIS